MRNTEGQPKEEPAPKAGSSTSAQVTLLTAGGFLISAGTTMLVEPSSTTQQALGLAAIGLGAGLFALREFVKG